MGCDTFQSRSVDKPGYINIDELQARTSLEDAATKCGALFDLKGSGKEVRIDCPFGCSGDHCGHKEVAINSENPQKVFLCHAYACKFRGNLLTLMHGWLTGSRPAGDKLKGEEFRRVRDLLAGTLSATKQHPTSPKPDLVRGTPPPATHLNVPLIRSTDERVRELHDIDSKFLVDPAGMNPAASSYVRTHACLSPESMKKWRCGYLPNDGGGDKRGWSLRGHIVYPVLSEDSHVLAWVGRDVNYEEKEREFQRLPAEERVTKSPPAKYHFPKGFQRGQELFGQQGSRLRESGYREYIQQFGLIVTEGMNDTIALDALHIPSVAIMSNHMTTAQVERVTKWAKALARGQVTLMFDCDEPGDEDAKEALWLLTQRGLSVRLAWSSAMHAGMFRGRQPESLRAGEINALIQLGLAC